MLFEPRRDLFSRWFFLWVNTMAKKQLDRALGLYSAITISVGTMIGSAIFVLAGISYDVAGPSASLAVFLAGIGAFFTAFSFCELVTLIPESGGGYAYVRESTGNGIWAFVTGWGFWLAYAMSCGLFSLGFGTFFNYFFPFIPRMVAAYALIMYVMITNIKGVENSGKLQNVITTVLILLLGIYMIGGVFFMDLGNQRPFFSDPGIAGMLNAMGFLYITYIGYGLVTTASEEVSNPEKTIPRAIIISLILVTVIKTGVFFIGASVKHWQELLPAVTDTPLTDTAIRMAGGMGGYLFAFAGILATVSSINTAMMATSRTSFAMARDRHLPALFKNINSVTKTPVFSILAATTIVIIATGIKNLEDISTITSIFALTGYSFVNVALIVHRRKHPDKARAFRVPFYPFMPLAGIAVNLFLVFQLMRNNPLALFIAVGITTAGIIYFYLVKPLLEEAPKGISTRPVPALRLDSNIIIEDGYRVLLPVASPFTLETLIDIGIKLTGAGNGRVIPLHISEVPEVISLGSDYYDFLEQSDKYRQIVDRIEEFAGENETVADPLLILSRHRLHALKTAVAETEPDMVVMGWPKSGFAQRILGNISSRAMEELPTDVGVFKPGDNREIKKMLFPYGGGYHSQQAAAIAKRVSDSSGARITLFRIIEQDIQEPGGRRAVEAKTRENAVEMGFDCDIKCVESESIAGAIIKESAGYDLVVMGAGGAWGISGSMNGVRADRIMRKIKCSGLVIRKHGRLTGKKRFRFVLSRIKTYLLD